MTKSTPASRIFEEDVPLLIDGEPLTASAFAAIGNADRSAVVMHLDDGSAVAQPGGEPADELHVTLCAGLTGATPETLDKILTEFARTTAPLDGKIGGVGTFDGTADALGVTKAPMIAIPDVPGLQDHHHKLSDALSAAGASTAADHGWVPHITLAYADGPTPAPTSLLGTPIRLSTISVINGDEREDYPLGGDPSTVQQIGEVAASIEHCGDYGYAYWNPETQDVWWVACDGDPYPAEPGGGIDGGDAPAGTEFPEIERMFKAIAGVKSVTIEAENMPPLGYFQVPEPEATTASGIIPHVSRHISHLRFDLDGNIIERHVRHIRGGAALHRTATMGLRPSMVAKGDDEMADPTDEDRYFGLRNADRTGYDGVILQQFKDGGLTLFYMSDDGWVENNALIEDLHDPDSEPVTAEVAASIAKDRFAQTL